MGERRRGRRWWLRARLPSFQARRSERARDADPNDKLASPPPPPCELDLNRTLPPPSRYDVDLCFRISRGCPYKEVSTSLP